MALPERFQPGAAGQKSKHATKKNTALFIDDIFLVHALDLLSKRNSK